MQICKNWKKADEIDRERIGLTSPVWNRLESANGLRTVSTDPDSGKNGFGLAVVCDDELERLSGQMAKVNRLRPF